MKRTLISLAALLAFSLSCYAQEQKTYKHHVVMEMSLATLDGWADAITHINVLRNAFKGDVQIEMVFLGEGLAAVEKTDTKFAALLEKAARDGVVLAACQNSMRKRKVKSEDLFPFAVEVPSGLAEVVLKQEAGYSYLKMSYDAPIEK